MKRFAFCLISSVALLWGAPALAMSCDEIMDEVQHHVPTAVIIRHMRASGAVYSSADVECLRSRNAPGEIVAVAMAMRAPQDNHGH